MGRLGASYAGGRASIYIHDAKLCSGAAEASQDWDAGFVQNDNDYYASVIPRPVSNAKQEVGVAVPAEFMKLPKQG